MAQLSVLVLFKNFDLSLNDSESVIILSGSSLHVDINFQIFLNNYHYITKDEYNLCRFVIKMISRKKRQQQNYDKSIFIFALLAFALFHQGIVITAAIYYSKTKCKFYVRAVEHMGISHLTSKRLKNVKQSAISDHLLTCGCNINFNGSTILSKDSNNINLLIKESLLISRDKPILNKTVKSFPLDLFE